MKTKAVEKSGLIGHAQIDLSCLDIKIESLQLPDTISTKTLVTSKLKGKTANNETKEIPFTARITIFKSSSMEILTLLGLNHQPLQNIALSLFMKKQGEASLLEMSLIYKYKGRATTTRQQRVNERYFEPSEGPYGIKTHGGWAYDTVTVPYTYPVDKTERLQNIVDQDAFNQLYLAILNTEQNQDKINLIDFLHENFAGFSERAQNWISEQVHLKLDGVKASLSKQLLEMESQVQRLESIKLPKVRKG